MTIITVGIGIDVSAQELKRLASSPGNSILLHSLGNATLLPVPEQQLINTVFGKKHTKVSTYVRSHWMPQPRLTIVNSSLIL